MSALDPDPLELLAEVEAVAAGALVCRRCGTPFPAHNGGGPVRVGFGGWSSPAAAVPVTCPGFQWIDAAGTGAGYSSSR